MRPSYQDVIMGWLCGSRNIHRSDAHQNNNLQTITEDTMWVYTDNAGAQTQNFLAAYYQQVLKLPT